VNAASADQIRALAQRAKVCGLDQDPTIALDLREVIATANRDQRLLSTEELQRCCRWSGVDCAPLVSLQDLVPALVDRSRSALLSDEPDLVKPGGKLHPQERADACWRDCFHFLRVCCYAAAAGKPQFTDPQGMAALGELYAALGVPVDGLLLALHNLQQLAIRAYAKQASSGEVRLLEQAFVELQREIKGCVITSC